MILFPAIDLLDGKAVRLYKGDYERVTVYNEDPIAVARDFAAAGASHIHLVDLEGARDGTAPHLSTVCRIKEECGLFAEIGGGIRSMSVVDAYLSAGVDRVILGTAALKDPAFLNKALEKYAERIAVGVDIKDGRVAVRGWTETSDTEAFAFCRRLESLGVRTVICTDVSRDGAMQGTNHALYRALAEEFSMNFIASGGVSSLEDLQRLRTLGLYGAILGKAYYTGAVNLKEAIEVSEL